jgi:hypothetical protein
LLLNLFLLRAPESGALYKRFFKYEGVLLRLALLGASKAFKQVPGCFRAMSMSLQTGSLLQGIEKLKLIGTEQKYTVILGFYTNY